MRDEMKSRGLLMIERLLFILGIACLGWTACIAAEAWRFQLINRSLFAHIPATTSPPDADRHAVVPIGDAIGMVQVPRLHLSAVVANGDDDETLRVAVGHLPDTPLPWQKGNSTLAGHRDTFFRALQGIRINDDVRVETSYGDFLYQVRRIAVVAPDDLSVLAPTPEDALTLVTCYPFSFVGHASRRFVVQAARISRQRIAHQ